MNNYYIEMPDNICTYIYYGDGHEDRVIDCDIPVVYPRNSLRGFYICDHCNEIIATFEAYPSPREDGVGAIYLETSIANVAQFQGCETIADCERIASN
jgi:hypothetical protein